ncbi:hypothetical protein, partial [Moorena sp. SIO3B2]|uniref:hypothetical protein n=1 Tax=Moorena sp. SIO3B2 TaxID=2607827 RepID=UPI0013CD07A4
MKRFWYILGIFLSFNALVFVVFVVILALNPKSREVIASNSINRFLGCPVKFPSNHDVNKKNLSNPDEKFQEILVNFKESQLPLNKAKVEKYVQKL